jgi:hypothetical protein
VHRVGALLTIMAASAALAAGCGSSSSDPAAGRNPGEVARAYTAAMWRLDFHEACELEFTNRHGPPYLGMTEADKKRECETGWQHARPLQPGAPVPPEMHQVKILFGLPEAVVASTEDTGRHATVILRDPKSGEHREIWLLREGSDWQVSFEEIGELLGG